MALEIKTPQEVLEEKRHNRISWAQVDRVCDWIWPQLNQNFNGNPFQVKKPRTELTKEEEVEVIKRFEDKGWRVSPFQEDRAEHYWLQFEKQK